MKSSRWFPLLALWMLCLNGCATGALWESDRFARYKEPARPVNLRVFESRAKGDVLVQYDEWRDDQVSIRRRSYWLGQNCEPVTNPHKPRFVSSKRIRGLAEVPVFNLNEPGAVARSGLYAVAMTNRLTFTLYDGDTKLADYELPVYADASGRVKKGLLTPFTVAADIAVLAADGFLCAWASGDLNRPD